MTFFYDLNKRLKEVLEQPKSVHQQLNEGAKPDFLDVDKDGNKKESFKKAVADKKKSEVDEGMLDSLKAGMAKAGKVAKKVGGKALDTLGHGSDEDMIKDLQRKMGLPQTGKKPRTPIAKEEYGPLEEEQPDYSAKKARAGKDIGKPGKQFAKISKSAGERYGSKERGEKVAGAVLAKLRAKESAGEIEEGWDEMMKDVQARAAKPRVGDVERGHKHDIEHTSTGRRVTRRTDDQGYSVGADDAEDTAPIKRGRGRPKKTDKAPERVTSKAWKHKSGRVAEAGEEELDEKAVSKAQQRFMGMVHATQKGEKAPSKEVAKVAKSMKKKDAEDFAATKHKGLPEKVKSKKKEESVKETSDETPKSSTSGKGLQFGKGIYDSLNREIENIIAESMSINISSDSEGHKNLTVTANDEDAVKLAQVLKMAGIDQHDSAEQVEENQPDWPTDEVTSDDALQYAGGLNKPKTTVAGDGQTTVPVTAVQVREEEIDEQEQVMAPESVEEAKEVCEVCEAVPCKCDESVEESLARFRSLAGIQEAKHEEVEEEKTEEGNLFTGNLAKARAAGKKEADLDGDGDLEKVKESVNKLTNLWKAYRG